MWAAAEGEVAADGEEAVVEVPKKELKVWEANTSEIKGVLSVDTMGTGRPFTAEEELFVKRKITFRIRLNPSQKWHAFASLVEESL